MYKPLFNARRYGARFASSSNFSSGTLFILVGLSSTCLLLTVLLLANSSYSRSSSDDLADIISALSSETQKPVSQIHLSFSGIETSMVIDFVSLESSTNLVEYVNIKHEADTSQYLIVNTSTIDIYRQEIGYLQHAEMIDLIPSQQYLYRIINNTGHVLSASNTGNDTDYGFTHLFTAGSSFSHSSLHVQGERGEGIALIYGDFGLQKDISMDAIYEASDSGQFDYVLHIGDISYDLFRKKSTVGNTFMQLISRYASRRPYMVAAGNHEAGDNFKQYNARFAGIYSITGQNSASNSNFYYSFNVGSIHYIVVDTEVYKFSQQTMKSYYPFTAQQQLQWLESDLQVANLNRDAQPWIVMLGHKGWYMDKQGHLKFDLSYLNKILNGKGSTATSNSEIAGNYSAFDALSCKYGVDLFIGGHMHIYQRFLPLTSTRAATEAEVYLQPPAMIDHETITQKRCNSLREPLHLTTSDVIGKHYYCNPKYTTNIVIGSPGCHSELPRGSCALFEAISETRWSNSMASCSTDYGYGYLQVMNRTHLYFETVVTGYNSFYSSSISGGTTTSSNGHSKEKGVDRNMRGETETGGLDVEDMIEHLKRDDKFSYYMYSLEQYLLFHKKGEHSKAEYSAVMERALQKSIPGSFIDVLQGNKERRLPYVRDHVWIVQEKHGMRDYC
jgi:acid phosphatase type 7